MKKWLILLVVVLLTVVISGCQRKGTITLLFNGGAYVYGQNGKRLSTFRGKKAHFTQKTTLTYYGSVKWLKGKPYYDIGDGGYIHTRRVAIVDHKNTFLLWRNSYVYDKNGKRLKSFRGSQKPVVLNYKIPVHFVGKGKPTQEDKKYFYNLKELSDKRGDLSGKHWLPYRKIKGKYYYNLGDGGYIKAYNVLLINGWFNYSNGVKVKVAYRVLSKTASSVNHDEQVTNTKAFKRGTTVTVDATKWMNTYSNGAQYYRIKGTKDTFIGGNDLASDPQAHRLLIDLPSN